MHVDPKLYIKYPPSRFKECFFSKLIYYLQIWNMERMKFAMAKLKKKMNQGKNERWEKKMKNKQGNHNLAYVKF